MSEDEFAAKLDAERGDEPTRADKQLAYETPGTSTRFMDDLGHMFVTEDCGGDLNFDLYSLEGPEHAFASLNPPEVRRLHRLLTERVESYK